MLQCKGTQIHPTMIQNTQTRTYKRGRGVATKAYNKVPCEGGWDKSAHDCPY